MQKKIIFFMIVTPRDAIIADYSIKSYMKLYKKYYKQLPFTLYIYANTFTQNLKDEYFEKWKKLPYVELYDNAEKKDKITKMGAEIISPEGQRCGVWSHCELPAVIWSEAFLKFETQYWATVDADFEILNPKFIIRMIDKLDNNDNLVAMSSDYSDTGKYKEEHQYLYKRYHTWFCIYKKKAQVCRVSHYFYSVSNNSERLLYDDAAYFQKHLREDYGFDMDVVDPINQRQFIHYGAFGQNRLINKNNVKKFRKLAIASKIGGGVPSLRPFDRLCNYINRKIQKHAAKEFNKYFADSVEDRKYVDNLIANSDDPKYDKFRDANNTKV